jgi:predicted membrane channel-forming protein YqfA (hemolysin III family)
MSDWPERLTLSLSNLFFLAPMVMLWRQPRKQVIAEIFFLCAITITSTFYHLCDNGSKETKVCILPWSYLYLFDFVLSYQMAYLVFFYDLNIEPIIKYIALVLSLTINIMFMFVPKEIAFFNYITLVLIGSLSVYIRYKYYKLRDLNLQYLLIALVYVFAATIVKNISPSEYKHYWVFHSLWHVLISFAIMFSFNIEKESIRNLEDG